MCDTYRPNGKPLKNNHRYNANKIFNNEIAINEKPWYGIDTLRTCIWQHASDPIPIHLHLGDELFFKAGQRHPGGYREFCFRTGSQS